MTAAAFAYPLSSILIITYFPENYKGFYKNFTKEIFTCTFLSKNVRRTAIWETLFLTALYFIRPAALIFPLQADFSAQTKKWRSAAWNAENKII